MKNDAEIKPQAQGVTETYWAAVRQGPQGEFILPSELGPDARTCCQLAKMTSQDMGVFSIRNPVVRYTKVRLMEVGINGG